MIPKSFNINSITLGVFFLRKQLSAGLQIPMSNKSYTFSTKTLTRASRSIVFTEKAETTKHKLQSVYIYM